MMSSQGRSSALLVVVVMVCIIHTEAAVFTVGDSAGWTFSTATWTKGKRFRAGDVLAFNYASGAHNVVLVNKAGYDSCRAPSGAKMFKAGGDKIKLAKGQNYFICSFPGHCESGMKIAALAM